MDALNEERATTMRAVVFNEDKCSVAEAELAWEAVWHFFIGGDKDFERMYERHQVNTRAEADKIYTMCSEYLYNAEFSVAEMLDTKQSEVLFEDILIPLSESIASILNT